MSGFLDVSLNNLREPPIFQRVLFYKSQSVGNHDFCKFGKRRAPKIMKVRLRISWKSGRWDQYLPENMKWKCGNTGSIYFQKHEMILNLWNQEILKPRNQDTLKQRSQEPKKPRNQETQKRWNQETKKPSNQETKRTRNQETKIPRNQETKKARYQETKNPLPLNMIWP